MIETENSPAVRAQPPRLQQSYFGMRPEKLSHYGLGIVVAYALLRSTFYAAIKPFWFDEVLTFVVSRQSSLSQIRAALNQGLDGNPPAFYLAEHWAASVVSNEDIGYRLLSIFAFACTLLFVFVFIKTRHGSQLALLSSAVLLITPLFTLYAQEARPYSLVVALIALAMVGYQRAARPIWTFALALSLTLAALLHYYTLLILAPFFLAELAFFYFAKRFRWGVWLSLLVPLVPIAISFPRLLWMKQNWGPHFWAGAALSDVSAAYGNYFRVGPPWGMALCGLAVLMMLAPLWRSPLQMLRMSRPLPSTIFTAEESTPEKAEQHETTPIHERILVAALTALPLLGFAVAKATHGPFVERYFLPCILGFVVAAAFASRLAGPATMSASAAFVLLAISSQEVGFWKVADSRLTGSAIVSPLVAVSNMPQYPDLPIVLSDSGMYVEVWHYAPPALFQRTFTLPEPQQAVTFVRTDTVDKLVLALRPYAPSGIQDFSTFVAAHRRFLLYSNGSRIDWLPSRLVRDGYQLHLIEAKVRGAVYLVEPPVPHEASTPSASAPAASVPALVRKRRTPADHRVAH